MSLASPPFANMYRKVSSFNMSRQKKHFDQYKNTYYEIFNINFGIRADLLYETAKKILTSYWFVE